MRRYTIALLTVIGALVGDASAQGFNPWGMGGQANPWLQGGNQQIQQHPFGPKIGTLPNGTPVHNPWLQYRGLQPVVAAQQFNFSVQQNTNAILNPSLYTNFALNTFNRAANQYYNNLQANAYFNLYANNNNHGYNNFGYNGIGTYPYYEKEVGSFVPVNPQVAINPVSGTVLNPIRGVAYTREGTFYRVPGTASYSPWGNPIYGSGVYYNPFTGARYSPLTGVIAR